MKDEIEDITEGYTPPACSGCRSMGVLHIVMGGETCGNAKPIERNHIAPYGYVALATIPCDCDRGKLYAAKKQKLENPEKVVTATMPSGGISKRRQWLLRECVFSDPWKADYFVKCCIAEREGRPHPRWKTMAELVEELMGSPKNQVARVAVGAMTAAMPQKRTEMPQERETTPAPISKPVPPPHQPKKPKEEITW